MSYFPGIMRFISADTIVPDPTNPQTLNRYTYALNNPVKYTDPSGHDTECAIGESGCHFKSRKLRDAQQLVSEQIVGGGNQTWDELTPEQRDDLSLLSPGNLGGEPIYWNEHRWNVETLHDCGACSVAGTQMDPAVWIAEFILFRQIGQWLPEILSSGAGSSTLNATASTAKFSEYIFKQGATHGKDAVFSALGYSAEDSAQLAEIYATQATAKYAQGAYTLGNLDKWGQRINITIDLAGQGNASGKISRLISGWMINPDGTIRLITPFSGHP